MEARSAALPDARAIEALLLALKPEDRPPELFLDSDFLASLKISDEDARKLTDSPELQRILQEEEGFVPKLRSHPSLLRDRIRGFNESHGSAS